ARAIWMRTCGVGCPFVTSTIVPLSMLRALSFIRHSIYDWVADIAGVHRASGFLRAYQLADGAKFPARRRARVRFDRSVEIDDPLADRGECRPAAVAPTGLRRDRRFAQGAVDLLAQQPCPAVRPPERARRRRDRPGRSDRLQERDLAWPDAVSARQIDADGKTRGGHDGGLPGMDRGTSRHPPLHRQGQYCSCVAPPPPACKIASPPLYSYEYLEEVKGRPQWRCEAADRPTTRATAPPMRCFSAAGRNAWRSPFSISRSFPRAAACSTSVAAPAVSPAPWRRAGRRDRSPAPISRRPMWNLPARSQSSKTWISRSPMPPASPTPMRPSPAPRPSLCSISCLIRW